MLYSPAQNTLCHVIQVVAKCPDDTLVMVGLMLKGFPSPRFAGMIGAMSRHLKSLRLMQRDHGWIHTLLEEAENERMHLLTAMELRCPGKLFRGAVVVAQGKVWLVQNKGSVEHWTHRVLMALG